MAWPLLGQPPMVADRIIPFPSKTEGYGFRELGEQIRELGLKNPVALAFAALTVGFAAGILLSRNLTQP